MKNYISALYGENGLRYNLHGENKICLKLNKLAWNGAEIYVIKRGRDLIESGDCCLYQDEMYLIEKLDIDKGTSNLYALLKNNCDSEAFLRVPIEDIKPQSLLFKLFFEFISSEFGYDISEDMSSLKKKKETGTFKISYNFSCVKFSFDSSSKKKSEIKTEALFFFNSLNKKLFNIKDIEKKLIEDVREKN